jgi:hypothetical protein
MPREHPTMLMKLPLRAVRLAVTTAPVISNIAANRDLRFDVVHPAPTFKPMFPATSSDFVRRFIVTSFVSTRTTMDRYRKVPHVLEAFSSASHRYLGKSPKFDSDVSQRADLLHACFSD